MTRERVPLVCRCGRMTRDWIVVKSLKLCPECAYDEIDGDAILGGPTLPGRIKAHDYVRPQFTIRRVH